MFHTTEVLFFMSFRTYFRVHKQCVFPRRVVLQHWLKINSLGTRLWDILSFSKFFLPSYKKSFEKFPGRCACSQGHSFLQGVPTPKRPSPLPGSTPDQLRAELISRSDLGYFAERSSCVLRFFFYIPARKIVPRSFQGQSPFPVLSGVDPGFPSGWAFKSISLARGDLAATG